MIFALKASRSPGLRHVGLDRRVGGHLPVAHCIELDQQPRRVTHGRDDLARIQEVANELQRLSVDAQQVGIDLPAGQHDGVVLGGAHFIEGLVDCDALAPVLALPAADLTLLRRYDHDLRAGVPQLLPRHLQLGLFESVGRENDHFGTADFRHDTPPSLNIEGRQYRTGEFQRQP
jgi:hypothetical protein